MDGWVAGRDGAGAARRVAGAGRPPSAARPLRRPPLLPRGAGGLSELTTRPVRDKLARLTQVATLLGAEDAAEVAELWGDAASGGLVTWQLSETDVRSVLRQRVDLPYEEVQRLRL